jgi:hypothetical protein
MIYRNWSLLSSTVVIWGSVATAGLAGIFLFGGKVTNRAKSPIRNRPFPSVPRSCRPFCSAPTDGLVCP